MKDNEYYNKLMKLYPGHCYPNILPGMKVPEEEKIRIGDITKAIWNLKHGYWYNPKIPIKYAKKRVYDGLYGKSYHYETLPIKWKKGKKIFMKPISPILITTDKTTIDKIKTIYTSPTNR